MFKEFFIKLIEQYGNIGLLIGLILEFLGLPIPGETMMSVFGFMARKSNSSIINPILFSTIGTYFGSVFAYILSYKYGEPVVLKLGRLFSINKEKLDKSSIMFKKYMVVLLLFSRFVVGVRHVVPYLSGIGKLNPKKFLILNLIGSVIWTIAFVGLGYYVGDKWKRIEAIGKVNIIIAIVLILFVVLVFKFFKKHKITIFAITFPILIFIKLSEDLIREELSVFDNAIYKFLSKFIFKDAKFLMQFISFLGYAPFLIAVTLLVYYFLRNRAYYSKYWILISINLASSLFITEIFKVLFHRDRPDVRRLIEVTGYSFPSGHSMVGLSFYGLLIYLVYINFSSYRKYLVSALLGLLIFSIGLSRVYLGVHYASDVLAGFAAGLAWLVIYITIIRKYEFFNLKNRVKVEKSFNPLPSGD